MDVQLDGRAVGNLDLQVCRRCRRGIIHDVRTEPTRRRQGLARLAISKVMERYPGFSWSTSAVPQSAEARAFWTALSLPTPGEPVTCRHMRAADDPGGTRREPAEQSWGSTRPSSRNRR